MPNVSRWEPFRDLATFRDDINRVWSDALSHWPNQGFWRGSGWAPAVDVHETQDDVVVTAEVPGINREDIDISVSGDTVTISGRTAAENAEEDKNHHYHRRERYWGEFTRTVQLPAGVDATKSKAVFRNGLLTVTMAKSEQSKTKKIPIEGQ
ncbi:MAG: Hsp20/alpha crystallin family protein [Bacillota bacterium]